MADGVRLGCFRSVVFPTWHGRRGTSCNLELSLVKIWHGRLGGLGRFVAFYVSVRYDKADVARTGVVGYVTKWQTG